MKYNTSNQKIIREEPLANRIVDALIHKWIQNATAHAKATNDNEETYKGILNMQGPLDEYWIDLTPKIIDELKRAGLLKNNQKEQN